MIEGMVLAVITFVVCWFFAAGAAVANLAARKNLCPIWLAVLGAGFVCFAVGVFAIGAPALFGAGVGAGGFLSWKYRNSI